MTRFQLFVWCFLFVSASLEAQIDTTTAARIRNVRPIDASDYTDYVYRERWAVLVGISKYKDPQLKLDYAARDADVLFDLITTPSGGGFKPENIRRLTDSLATRDNIYRALRTFLKTPAKEDIVLIYFACHGVPDPDKTTKASYLLPYDTDPSDISGTALDMDEIDVSLKKYVKAERVIVLVDACHSAAVGGKIGRGELDEAKVAELNTYLQAISASKPGIAVMTSAAADQVAREDKKWGGGHGVFTHFLLEGLSGKANTQPEDGFITIGELFDYVGENVKNATNKQQNATPGPNEFDRNFVLAVTGGIQAQEHYQLGCQLYELGFLLYDWQRFKAAIHQFYAALNVNKNFAEAQLEVGRSFIAVGENSEAIKALEKTLAMAPSKTKTLAEAYFLLGIALAKEKKYTDAANAFELFLQRQPQDENAGWVKEYITQIKQGGIGKPRKKYALLIGINRYLIEKYNLNGAVNDVMLVKNLLMGKYGFLESNITLLLDRDATRNNILNQFELLRNLVTSQDLLYIHYSGQAIGIDTASAYLMPHDGERTKGLNSIDANELHNSIKKIPTANKILVLDTNPNLEFLRLARQEANYTLFLAASPSENAYDGNFEKETYGVLTYNFVQQILKLDHNDARCGQIIDNVVTTIKVDSTRKQTPLLVGDRGRILFEDNDSYLDAYDFAQRKNFISLNQGMIKQKYDPLQKQLAAPFSRAHYGFGRAFLEKGNYPEAIAALQTALDQRGGKYPEAQLSLGVALVYARQYAAALTHFQDYVSSLQNPVLTEKMQEPIQLTETLHRNRKHALLIGINDYINPKIPDPRGAVNDVAVLKSILREKLGFQEENITVLLERQATRQAIMQAFKELLAKANVEPALFYFAGNGSHTTTERTPTIVSADGRQSEIFDIELKELATIADNAKANLTTIIDAGWFSDGSGSRSILPDEQRMPKPRDVQVIELEYTRLNRKKFSIKIGLISIYSGSINADFDPHLKLENAVESTEKNACGILTSALIRVLRQSDPAQLSYAQLVDSAYSQIDSLQPKPVLVGDAVNQNLFPYPFSEKTIYELVLNVEKSEPINTAISLLNRLIEQRHGNDPEANLNLGVAYAAKGDHVKSIEALEKSIAQALNNFYPEARYHLGRVRLESDSDLALAVSELTKATQQDSTNIPAFYYLGEAIRLLTERVTLVQVEKAFQTYLEKGDPLGREDEVLKVLNFLQERKNVQQSIEDMIRTPYRQIR